MPIARVQWHHGAHARIPCAAGGAQARTSSYKDQLDSVLKDVQSHKPSPSLSSLDTADSWFALPASQRTPPPRRALRDGLHCED